MRWPRRKPPTAGWRLPSEATRGDCSRCAHANARDAQHGGRDHDRRCAVDAPQPARQPPSSSMTTAKAKEPSRVWKDQVLPRTGVSCSRWSCPRWWVGPCAAPRLLSVALSRSWRPRWSSMRSRRPSSSPLSRQPTSGHSQPPHLDGPRRCGCRWSSCWTCSSLPCSSNAAWPCSRVR